MDSNQIIGLIVGVSSALAIILGAMKKNVREVICCCLRLRLRDASPREIDKNKRSSDPRVIFPLNLNAPKMVNAVTQTSPIRGVIVGVKEKENKFFSPDIP